MDDVAGIDLAEADAAVERRRDGRVGELRLRVLDRALVGIDHRLELVDLGLLLVEALLGGEVALASSAKRARSFCAEMSCAWSCAFLATACVERRLQRARIDHGERVALCTSWPSVNSPSAACR